MDVITSLLPGDTITMIENGVYKRIPHNSWWTAWRRNRHDESRWKTLRYVDDILTKPFNNSSIDRLFLVQLEQAATGLNNLRETYSVDNDICREIDKRRQKLLSFIEIHRDIDRPHRYLHPLPQAPRVNIVGLLGEK